MQPRVPAQGNKASKPLSVKTVEEAAAGETPSLTGESSRDPHDPRMYTSSPTWELVPERAQSAHRKGGTRLKVGRELSSIVLSLTPPPHTAPQHPTLANT